MMKSKNWVVTFALVLAFVVTTTASASADKIKLRIGSGHPTGVVYAGLMQLFSTNGCRPRCC